MRLALSATSIFLAWCAAASKNGLPVSYSLLLAEKRAAPSSEAGSDASTRAATGAPEEAEKPSQTSASTSSGDAGGSGNGSNGSGCGGERAEGRKVAAELGVEQERDEGELREVYAGAGQSFTAEGLRPYTTYAVRVRARTQLQTSCASAPPLQVTTLEACTAPTATAAGSAPLHHVTHTRTPLTLASPALSSRATCQHVHLTT